MLWETVQGMQQRGRGAIEPRAAPLGQSEKPNRQPKGLGRPTGEGESPVGEGDSALRDGAQVPRGTRNPVGIGEDHLLRLNTPWRPIAESTVRER